MPYRELVDDGGVWIVFSTQPRSGANVRPKYANGWLSFHRGVERRRVSPIPSGWEDAADAQLRLWLRGAEVVTQSAEDNEALTGAGSRGSSRPLDGRESAEGEAAAAPASIGEEEVSTAAPASPQASAPEPSLPKSIKRIREMLSSIRDIT